MTEMTEPKRARGRPRTTEGERDDGNRRQAFISAAAQLFHRKGYDATSTREIAALVGMQPGSPFYHFGNKRFEIDASPEELELAQKSPRRGRWPDVPRRT